jgi:hypothetical protein
MLGLMVRDAQRCAPHHEGKHYRACSRFAFCRSPHPEERREAMRLEGWPRRRALGAFAHHALPRIQFSNSSPCTDTASRSRRRLRARFAKNVPPSEIQRAQGMPGARCTRSLACKIKQAYERSHHGHTGNHPAFPAQWFYGLLRALPGDQACLTPSPALLIADLTPASGRQNHTTWPYAKSTIRQRRRRVHRIPPRVRDDREPPLCGTGPNRYSADLPPPSSKISENQKSEGRLRRDDEMHLFFLRPEARNAFLYTQDSRGRHPGAGDFLDLARGARPVIDKDALTEPQIDNVLLARNLLSHRRRCERGQRETAQQNRTMPMACGRHGGAARLTCSGSSARSGRH